MIYATRVPERWKPGYFDLAFHSHQLFHVAVVLAALVRQLLSRAVASTCSTTCGTWWPAADPCDTS